MTQREHVPRWVYAPAGLGLAVVVVPLLALLPKVRWATFWTDITEPAIASALLLSARSAAIAVVLCVLLGVPLALLIARAPGRIAVVLRTIVTLPLVLPPLVGGVALLAVLGRTGFLGPWMESAGVAIPFTPSAVIVAQTFVSLPFLVISVEGALRSVGTKYERVAAGLGASRGRILTRVTLPLIGPGLAAGIVLAFARSVGEFGATALLAGNKPGITQTIPMAIYTAFNGVGTSRQAAMALSVLLVAVSLIVLLAFPVARGAAPDRVASASREPTAGVPPLPARALPTPGTGTAAGRDLHLNLGFSRPSFELSAALSVPAGSVLGVVGPNGAGKTTLLDLVAGHLTPSSGKISLGNETLSTPTDIVAARRRHIGMLSQDPSLFPHLSVVDNVAFGPRSRGVTARHARNRATEILRHVGMGGYEERRPAQLSGGQQQRVALARALATEPEILLLDEPLAAMDVSTAPAIRATIAREIARTGVGVIIITHDLLDVVALADHVAVLENGRVSEVSAVEDFLTRPTSPFGAAFTRVNVLPDPDSGRLMYLGAEQLGLAREGARAEETAWEGVIELVEVTAAQATARVRLDQWSVSVPFTLDEAASLLPGTPVRLTRLIPKSARDHAGATQT